MTVNITPHSNSQDLAEKISPASGYIYIYDVNSDNHAILFGNFGSSRYELVYDCVFSRAKGINRNLSINVKGDFSPLINNELINQIGINNVSFRVGVNKTFFYISFLPDPKRLGNALFQTSTNLRGAIIVSKSSDWSAVAIVGILGAVVVLVAGIVFGVGINIDTVFQIFGSNVEVSVSVNDNDRDRDDDDSSNNTNGNDDGDIEG